MVWRHCIWVASQIKFLCSTLLPKTYSEIVTDNSADWADYEQSEYEITVIGKEKVNGYNATHVKVKVKGGKNLQDMWTSTDIAGYADFARVKTQYTGKDNLNSALAAKGAAGFPVRVVASQDGQSFQIDLVKAEKKAVDKNLFSLSGYEKGGMYPGLPGSIDVSKLKDLQNMSPDEQRKLIEDLMKQIQNRAKIVAPLFASLCALKMDNPLILHIETATPLCSVSVARGEHLLAAKRATVPNSHARSLASTIRQLLDESGLAMQDLDAIAVSEGPGSYTGLRIGLSTAKGICYAADIPLVLINTLQATAAGMRTAMETDNDVCFIPVLDARRNDVYWSVFNNSLQAIHNAECNSIQDVMQYVLEKKLNAVVAGTGTFKFEAYQPQIRLLHDDVVDSRNFTRLALAKFQAKQFADLAYSEPIYRTT
jgi:tRNA threonylcarbamoyladenosine biosynthesis protein TsaB